MFEDLYPPDDKSDVIIQFQNGEDAKAHFFVLAAKNKIFRAMVLNNTIEKQTGIIKIEDCDAEVFKIFLKYLYTDEVPMEDISLDLLKISDRYLDDSLKKKCGEELGRNFTTDDVLDKFLAAINYNCDKLKHLAAIYVHRNLKDLMQKPEEFKMIYGNEQALEILFDRSIVVDDYDYFRTEKDSPSSYSLTIETHSGRISDFCELESTDDLFWSVKICEGVNASKITQAFLEITSKTSYFNCCTADVGIKLKHSEEEKSLFRKIRNIEIDGGKTSKICIVTDVNDLTNLKSKFGTPGFRTLRGYEIIEIPIEIKIDIYNVVKSNRRVEALSK